MSWIWAALMPHPPIILPEVGRGREAEAGATLEGVGRLKKELAGLPRPGVLLVLSPHHPYAPGSLLLNDAPRLNGSLAAFGAPQVRLQAEVPYEALRLLAEGLVRAGLPPSLSTAPEISRDHGTLVPLVTLTEVWGELPPLIVAGPIGLSPRKAFALGRALRGLDLPGNWALLASGDLSHRLLPDAPAGYNPKGKIFDQTLVEALKAGSAEPLLGLSPDVLDGAGECGLRSVLCLLGLTDAPLQVFSYEGPFGVGYCTALWKGEPEKRPGAALVHPYPALARLAVTRHLRGAPQPSQAEIRAVSPDEDLWNAKKACFVSIKTLKGTLRGCIGTILPLAADLGREIVMNAVSAAVRDPRFSPMRLEELLNVRFSVDVLSRPEATARDGLDPKRYGVIVTKDGRRGLLLPDLEGVDTVERQVSIAAQKAGIRNLEGATFQRFTVTRYPEE